LRHKQFLDHFPRGASYNGSCMIYSSWSVLIILFTIIVYNIIIIYANTQVIKCTLAVVLFGHYVYNISALPPSWDTTPGTVMSADESFVWNDIKQYPHTYRPHNTKLGHVNFRSNEPKGCYYVTRSPRQPPLPRIPCTYIYVCGYILQVG